MAKQQTSIFQGVLDALKRNPRRQDQNAQATSAPMVTPAFTPEAGNIEDVQQQFLDWQTHRIAHDLYTRTLYYDTNRVGAYQDFRAMDMSPEISAALNILRDECLTRSDSGDILKVYSENSRIKEVLKDLFKNKLNADYNMRLWIRDLLKYGDYFVHLHIDKKEGIYSFQTLPPEEVHREEGYDGHADSVRFKWETTNDYFEEWQIAHFRLLEDTKRLPYGRSLLDSARKLWKQLQLSEDAMLTYRITRAPERRVFYIDVGNLEDADVTQYIQKVQNRIKKQPVVSSQTGNMEMKYNPMNISEDYFIPIRGDKSSKIETLPGACLALDTKIPLLDGRTLELRDIIKEWDEGNRNLWVYSCNPENGELAPGMITWAGVTRKNTDVLKITLDNGKEIISTPDHKFVHRTKGFVEAKDLIEGDSLMPFYRDEEYVMKRKYTNKYERVWDSEKKSWVFTHRMVINFMKDIGKEKYFVFNEEYKNLPKKTIHHSDHNRKNNNVDNLVFMNNKDHKEYHQNNIKNILWSTPEKAEINKEKIRNGLNNYIENLSPEEKLLRAERSKKNRRIGSDRFINRVNTDPEFKKMVYENMSKASKITKNLPENKEKYSENSKKLWKDEKYKNRVFSKPQKIVFTDDLYNMFFQNFLLHGRADLTLESLNKDVVFLNEFRSHNGEIRSSMANLNEFTLNHLKKMLSERGFKSYREWCKIKAKELGYKNVRAWRYYIFKAQKQNELYNHKIVKIEFLTEKQDTGTITVDGDEIYHKYHTLALDSEVFVKNSNLDAIADIQYLQNKLFASLQVPKTYLNYAENLPGGSTLSQADLRFARTVNSIQEAVLLELRRIANIHLYFSGFKDDIDNFTLSLTNPSTQQELLKLETMKARLEIFNGFFGADATSPTSYTWAMENILGFSKSDIKLFLKQKKVEKKIFAEIDSAVETYKKIGLFKELDEKYELPGAPQTTAAEEPGGEGKGSNKEISGSFGGGGFGGGFELGGGEETAPGGEAGAPEAAAPAPEAVPETPLAESSIRTKMNKLLKESDNNVNRLIDELLGEDERPKTESEKEEEDAANNPLLESNKILNTKSKKLIDTIESSMNFDKSKNFIKTVLKEEEIVDIDENSLVKSNETMISNTKDIIEGIEKMMELEKKKEQENLNTDNNGKNS